MRRASLRMKRVEVGRSGILWVAASDLFFNICLLTWLCQVLVAAHGIFHLCCNRHDLSVAAWELLGVAGGIKFPDQGLNPVPLHWECRVLATGPLGKSLLDQSLPKVHSTFVSFKFCYCCLICKLCLTLCDPRLLCPWDFQARILHWVAISFSRGSSWSRDGSHVSGVGRGVLYH